MKRTKAISHITLSLIAVLCLFIANGRAQSIPSEVQTALEKYASLNMISIEWDGTLTMHDEKLSQPLHEEFIVTSSYAREGQSFSWMHEVKGKAADYPYPPFKRICRFDGNVLSEANGRVQALWYKITPDIIEKQPKAGLSIIVPYFDAVGVYYPTRMEDLPKGTLQSNILHLMKNGGKLVSCEKTQLEQEDVIRIEIVAENPAWEEILRDYDNTMKLERSKLKIKIISQKEFDEIQKTGENTKKTAPQTLRWVYYLSPKNGYAVWKHERLTLDGRTVVSYSNSDFQVIPGTQVTLAGRVKINTFEQWIGSYRYEILSTPACSRDMSIVKVSTEAIPREQFVLSMKEVAPGAQVIDMVTPGLRRENGSVIVFTMPDSLDDLDAAIEKAKVKTKR